jgi:hypothetical protein
MYEICVLCNVCKGTKPRKLFHGPCFLASLWIRDVVSAKELHPVHSSSDIRCRLRWDTGRVIQKEGNSSTCLQWSNHWAHYDVCVSVVLHVVGWRFTRCEHVKLSSSFWTAVCVRGTDGVRYWLFPSVYGVQMESDSVCSHLCGGYRWSQILTVPICVWGTDGVDSVCSHMCGTDRVRYWLFPSVWGMQMESDADCSHDISWSLVSCGCWGTFQLYLW